MAKQGKLACFNCTKEVDENYLRNVDPDEYDDIVSWYGLVHLSGPKEQFEADGTVVMCQECCLLAL